LGGSLIAFAYAGECKAKLARKMNVSERIAKAKEYEAQGFSRGQISRLIGVSKASITNYLDGYPYKNRVRKSYFINNERGGIMP
jgi:predicted transcriptional regulator